MSANDSTLYKFITGQEPLKFSRDLESDWTFKNDKPHYGLKEHTTVKWSPNLTE